MFFRTSKHAPPELACIVSLRRRVEHLESELGAVRKELERDPLTGVGNRRALESRQDARRGWLVLADLDGFKAAQDAHPDGHGYGDEVLREFAGFLTRTMRQNPRAGSAPDHWVARHGGDEFAVWCPTKRGAQAIKARVRKWRSQCGAVGASAGMGQTMSAADAALYLNKSDRKAKQASSRRAD